MHLLFHEEITTSSEGELEAEAVEMGVSVGRERTDEEEKAQDEASRRFSKMLSETLQQFRELRSLSSQVFTSEGDQVVSDDMMYPLS